jgi:hypothetical protein
MKRCRDYFQREEHTRYALVDVMLRALGWDVSEPSQVKVEYRTDQPPQDVRRVDYALFVPTSNDPVVIVEAKAIGSNDIAYYLGEVEDSPDTKEGDWVEWDSKDVDQLERYCESHSVGYGVLTNGDFWDIYDLSKEGSFKEKRKKYFPVANTDLDDSVEALKLLHRRNVLKKFNEAKS